MNTTLLTAIILGALLTMALMRLAQNLDLRKTAPHQVEDLQSEIYELELDRDALLWEIADLRQERADLKTVNHGELTATQSRIMDNYADQGIRLPIDIQEELTYHKIIEEKEIYNFIESQRQQWKMEMQKKPYRKGGK